MNQMGNRTILLFVSQVSFLLFVYRNLSVQTPPLLPSYPQ